MRTRYARSGAARIAYELRGRSRLWRRWLLLIQGLGFDRSGWDPVSGALAQRFRVILVDNRGSGRSVASSVTAARLTVSLMARDVVAALDRARIRRTHVIGISLGGMIAQELAIEHPDRVDRLVLASTTPGWPAAHPMPAASVALMAATRGLPPETALRRHVENSLSARTVQDQPELVEELIAHQRSRPIDSGAWSAQAAAGARYSGGMRATGIRAPTLVLHGEADTVVDPRNAALLAARIPNSKLVLLPNLGHLFFWEQPSSFVDLVTGFLTETPG